MVRQLTATQRNRKSRSCTTGLTVYLNRYGKSFNSLPLKLAGFLNALPYGIELELEDPQETIRGFIDTLVVQEQLWILVDTTHRGLFLYFPVFTNWVKCCRL